jgi:rare lipoprotein A
MRAAAVLLAVFLFGCREPRIPMPGPDVSEQAYEVDGRIYHPLDSADGFIQQGVASWYGEQFHQKKTANSEIYNMHAMTAAHKTLPFGTMVEVKNLENNKTVIVRINDRGPFCRDRIIDLSYSAARTIDMIRKGTAAVQITALGADDELLSDARHTGPESIYFTGDFTIQAGSFSNPDNAENLKKSLEKVADNVHVLAFEKDSQTFYRVRVGRFTSLKQARETEKHLIENGFDHVYTVAWDL